MISSSSNGLHQSHSAWIVDGSPSRSIIVEGYCFRSVSFLHIELVNHDRTSKGSLLLAACHASVSMVLAEKENSRK